MKKQSVLILIFIFSGFLLYSQSITWPAESIKALTPEWKGERTPDGRPKVSVALLERLKHVSMEEVWGYLGSKGFHNQFENFASPYENGWQIIHPDEVMTGCVVTAQFMPLRPDLDNYVQDGGKKENMTTPVTNYAPINALTEGDVYVADSYCKMEEGTLIGDNLGNAIFNHSKRGIIFNGSVRDVEGLSEIKGFNGWIRGSDPSAISQMMLVSVNAPIRIGRVTVLPGDVVLAKKYGVTFIPAYLLEDLLISSEYTALRDEFNFFCIRTKKFEYNNEQFVDVTPEEFDKAFMEWLNEHPNLPMSKKELIDYIDARKAAEAANK